LSAVPEDQLVDREPDGEDADEDAAAWETWTEHTRPGRRRERRERPDGMRFTRRAVIGLIGLLVMIIIALVVILLLKGGTSTTSDPNAGATRQVESAHTALVAHRRSCPAGADQLTCRRDEAGALAVGYQDFTVDLDRITIPASASDARDLLDQDAALLSNAYDELSVATSNSAYDRIATREDVTALTGTFDRHYSALVSVLRGG
jgi:hypothetical protein